MATSDVGHVALDFDEGVLSGIPKQFNSLVVRPQYRISLRMGKIDDLCPHDRDTPEGRMERLQILGLFYFPLKHRKARNALDGETVCLSTQDPSTLEFGGGWEWVKTRLFGLSADASSDGDADDLIQAALEERVVGSWDADWTEVGKGTIVHGLPPAAPDPEAPTADHFAKIRLPGGYSDLQDPLWLCAGAKTDPAYTVDLADPNRHCIMEDYCYRDNPALGKIPLIATVEIKSDPLSEEWCPVEGATVYFQLLEPYALPTESLIEPAYLQYNHAILAPSVTVALSAESSTDSDPSNPLRENCPTERGGKRGDEVAGSLFATASIEGFHQPHSSGRKLDPEDRPWFPTGGAAQEGGIPYSVQATTDSDGEAGVVFLPSRTAGDRYRIRAFVGLAPGLESDGTEPTAIRVDTGTFVVWRNLRISRYLRKDANAGVWPDLLQEASAWIHQGNSSYDSTFEAKYLKQVGAAFQDANGAWHVTGLPKLNYHALAWKFAKAFCELEVDGLEVQEDGTLEAEPADAGEANAALQLAIQNGTTASLFFSDPFFNPDLAALLHDLWLVPNFPLEGSVAHLAMRTPTDYNALVPTSTRMETTKGSDGLERPTESVLDTIEAMLGSMILPGQLQAFSHNGYLPGLTILQAATSTTWRLLGLTGTNAATTASGLTFAYYRGSYVWGGTEEYTPDPTSVSAAPNMPYNYTSNVAHELGHALFRAHGPDYMPEREKPEDPRSGEHDDIKSTDNACLMSYVSCPGNFCAKCLLALRGWKLA